MNKKDILILILKVVIYACTLLLGVLGVTSLASCAVQRNSSIRGKATIITTDTTFINHSTLFGYPKR